MLQSNKADEVCAGTADAFGMIVQTQLSESSYGWFAYLSREAIVFHVFKDPLELR